MGRYVHHSRRAQHADHSRRQYSLMRLHDRAVVCVWALERQGEDSSVSKYRRVADTVDNDMLRSIIREEVGTVVRTEVGNIVRTEVNNIVRNKVSRLLPTELDKAVSDVVQAVGSEMEKEFADAVGSRVKEEFRRVDADLRQIVGNALAARSANNDGGNGTAHTTNGQLLNVRVNTL